MLTPKLLLAEIAYRKMNFVLSLLAVAVAALLFVAGPMLVDGYQQETRGQIARWDAKLAEEEQSVTAMRMSMTAFERQTADELARLEKDTRRLMRDLGFNLMIVHRDTNMSDFWASDFASRDMPQAYVNRLAADKRLTLVTHLVATLQGKVAWNDRKVLLVGYMPEVRQAVSEGKSPMGYAIREGTAFLGHELAAGHQVGDTIEVGGKSLRVERLLPEQGSKEDISIAVNLADAQAILEKPGRINQIMALGCRCAGSSLPNIRKQLAEILPDTQITEFHTLAVARAEQRDLVQGKQAKLLAEMKARLAERERILAERKQVVADLTASRTRIQRVMETLAGGMTPLVVLAAAVWIGLLAWSNVRQRRAEIGLLRALGKGSSLIATLFLGKAVLLGLLGAPLGILLGIGLARWLGTQALGMSVERFGVPIDLSVYALLGAPVLSALASYLPTLTALMQDPAIVLREP